MTPEENARLQLLFEDSMSTLTSAVEQLSHDLTQEMTLLDAAVQFVKEPLESTSNTGTPQAKVWPVLFPRSCVCRGVTDTLVYAPTCRVTRAQILGQRQDDSS